MSKKRSEMTEEELFDAREKARQYRLANKEKIDKYHLRYREKHADILYFRRKAWADRNPDKDKKAKEEWDKKNRDKKLAYKKRHYIETRETQLKYYRNMRVKNPSHFQAQKVKSVGRNLITFLASNGVPESEIPQDLIELRKNLCRYRQESRKAKEFLNGNRTEQ